MREVDRDIRTRARCQRLVDSREGWIRGKGQLPHERPCLDFPQKIQGQEVLPRIKAAVAHLRPPERRSPSLQECLSGDQSPAYSGSGERFLDEWSRDGHRWRLGRGLVWFKKLRTEDRAITIYRRTNNSSELVFSGELTQSWDEDFAALWVETMDEATFPE